MMRLSERHLLRCLRGTRGWAALVPGQKQPVVMVQASDGDVSPWGNVMGTSSQKESLRQTQEELERLHFPSISAMPRCSLVKQNGMDKPDLQYIVYRFMSAFCHWFCQGPEDGRYWSHWISGPDLIQSWNPVAPVPNLLWYWSGWISSLLFEDDIGTVYSWVWNSWDEKGYLQIGAHGSQPGKKVAWPFRLGERCGEDCT